MAWLGLLLGIAATAVLAPRVVALLAGTGTTAASHDGRALPTPAGAAVLVCGLLAYALLTLLLPLLSYAWLSSSGALVPVLLPGVPGALSDVPSGIDVPATASAWTGILAPVGALVLFPAVAAAAGLVDDLVDGPERGVRGHGAAARAGRVSAGVVKVLVIGSGAVLVAALLTRGVVLDPLRTLLVAALLALSANLVNLLDLRPGRAAKGTLVLLLAAVVLVLATSGTVGDLLPGLRDTQAGAADAGPGGRVGAALSLLLAVGPWLAPILLVGLLDLRGRVMLGDTGANLLGAVAGVALALALAPLPLLATGVTVAVLLGLTLLGELVSLSTLIERTPILRRLDALGRRTDRA